MQIHQPKPIGLKDIVHLLLLVGINPDPLHHLGIVSPATARALLRATAMPHPSWSRSLCLKPPRHQGKHHYRRYQFHLLYSSGQASALRGSIAPGTRRANCAFA